MKKLLVSCFTLLLCVCARAEMSVLDTLKSDERFRTFVEAIDKSGLHGEFASNEMTVFAPTEAAFQKIGDRETLLADSTRLIDLVKRHVILGHKLVMKDVTSESEYATLGELKLTVSVDGKVNGVAPVSEPLQASNGVIYVMDDVLDLKKDQASASVAPSPVPNLLNAFWLNNNWMTAWMKDYSPLKPLSVSPPTAPEQTASVPSPENNTAPNAN